MPENYKITRTVWLEPGEFASARLHGCDSTYIFYAYSDFFVGFTDGFCPHGLKTFK